MGDTATLQAAPQHLRALERANEVRLARAELKRRITAGEVTAAEVISECPWEAASMSLSELLISQHRWGRARCRRLLVSLGLLENKQIGTLTDRQRASLAAVLGAAGPNATGRALDAARDASRDTEAEPGFHGPGARGRDAPTASA